jgi:sugar phosphate isomerase/epimerase
MIRISAFADEIAADLQAQVDVLLSENIHYVDFRSAWGTNVLDLSDEQVAQARQIFQTNGIGVAAIGSPLGKVAIDADVKAHWQRFERAIAVAKELDTRYIRLFSFYPPSGGSFDDLVARKDEVIERLRKMAQQAREAGLILVHENEKDIYGDTIARNVELLAGVNHDHFRSVLDPANYLQCAQTPYPDAYEATQPWLEYVHIKDVRADGTLVVAGEGEAHWPELLRRLREDGYDGFLTLEPHLKAAGQYQGFSGPELFRNAAHALQHLLQEMEWKYA